MFFSTTPYHSYILFIPFIAHYVPCMCLKFGCVLKEVNRARKFFDLPQNQLYVTASMSDLFIYCTECIRMASHFCWLIIEKGQTELMKNWVTETWVSCTQNRGIGYTQNLGFWFWMVPWRNGCIGKLNKGFLHFLSNFFGK